MKWRHGGELKSSMAGEFGDGFGAAVNLEFFVAAADVAADGMDGDDEIAIRARGQRLEDLHIPLERTLRA
jgi:hypothetical protein